MTKVKICGITNLEDALFAADAGADALGFNFYQKSPRYIDPLEAQKIIERLLPFVCVIGVFVNESEPQRVAEIAAQLKLSAIQLHGDESPDYCSQLSEWRVIKALRVDPNFKPAHVGRYAVSAILLDAYKKGEYGGTGEIFAWDIAKEAVQYGRIILAGGLTLENVSVAVKTVRPYAVDVASGVESSPGKKDRNKVREFIIKVRSV
jgi:phosphoribosylanthranilate isomerase